MEQLEDQLKAADLRLDDGILDSIDRIVAPGTTINAADAGWKTPWLDARWRRRR
jgi:hypothetical protein